ncbi:hypothetical protein SCP_0701250 [Sparassis crispa]|uniref:Uncharacterized protein n=1 Tax=Sparassis crispa TaxID=139825 RepID=A0A401GRW3_9APHY|nr:hypothetical protein SCP_0701250 [Sparassis crispa]GBE84943.1 hypothetical protein SCP_0701250 [Sparassis crispa]
MAVLSIHDLHPEIISHIFVLGPSRDNSPIPYGTVDKGDEHAEESSVDWELLVSHVCRRWRDIAIQNPMLWSTIHFEKGMERSKVYLDRSRGVPLHVVVDFMSANTKQSSRRDYNRWRHLVDIFALIFPHVSRWRTFRLMLKEHMNMKLSIEELCGCGAAPLLEELYLDVAEAKYYFLIPVICNPKHQEPIMFRGFAPKLTHVSIRGAPVPWNRFDFVGGMVRLELAYHSHAFRPNFDAFAHMLCTSPELHTLILRNSGPIHCFKVLDGHIVPDDIGFRTISLPSVKKLVLTFEGDDAASVPSLVECLELPNVTDLQLSLRGKDLSDFLYSLARPSLSTGKAILAGLRSLKLFGFACSSTAVAEAYGALANVISLNLNFAWIGKGWYRFLLDPFHMSRPTAEAATDRPLAFCPQLTTLICTGLNGGELRDLVEARRAAGVPLQRLFVNREDYVEVETTAWLRAEVVVYERFRAEDDDIEANFQEPIAT